MGKMKRACGTCGLHFFTGYPMSKHRRMCHKAEDNQDDEDRDDAEEDDDAEEVDDELDHGAEEEDDAEEEEDDLFDEESEGSDESNESDQYFGDLVNAERRPRLLMTMREREVIKFLRMVESGEGMSVAQASDILIWGKSFHDERAQCLPKTLITCWRIVEKVMLQKYTKPLFV